MNATDLISRYVNIVQSIPESGGGGCHPAILGAANLGALAKLTPDKVFQDLRANIHGKRRVSDLEIHQAVDKAFRECGKGTQRTGWYRPRPTLDAAKMLRGILTAGAGANDVDLWELSPIRPDWPPENDAPELLRLYVPGEQLFIGTRYDTGADHVHTVADWRKRFEACETVPEHIIPNPLSGKLGQTKENKPSFRADNCVASFRFAVLEFDTTPAPLCESGTTPEPWPRESQCQFWAGALAFKWPIAALVDSGGKSIHTWLVVNVRDAQEWTATIEGELFARFLVPCGVDSSCKNEARLSRMPGHYRVEKSRWQKIIYLNPNAGKENQ